MRRVSVLGVLLAACLPKYTPPAPELHADFKPASAQAGA